MLLDATSRQQQQQQANPLLPLQGPGHPACSSPLWCLQHNSTGVAVQHNLDLSTGWQQALLLHIP
jgi:hypothetical protein